MTVDPADFDRLPAPPRTLPAPGFALDVVEDLVVFRLHWDANPLRPKREFPLFTGFRGFGSAAGDRYEPPETAGSLTRPSNIGPNRSVTCAAPCEARDDDTQRPPRGRRRVWVSHREPYRAGSSTPEAIPLAAWLRSRTPDSAQQRPDEIVQMSPDERTERRNALWQRLMDPDGFDRAALATIEGTTHIDQ